MGKLNKYLKDDGKKKANALEFIEPYHYVHFRIVLYKRPTNSLVGIFFPLLLLGLINMFVFYQSISLSDRIASLATLALAYIAFLPVINTNIPKNPGIIAV